jgi:hypothetical protein
MSAIKDVHDLGLVDLKDHVIVISSSILIGDEGMAIGVYDVGEVVRFLSGSG